MESPGNRHCANCIGALSFPITLSPNAILLHLGECKTSKNSDGTAHIGTKTRPCSDAMRLDRLVARHPRCELRITITA